MGSDTPAKPTFTDYEADTRFRPMSSLAVIALVISAFTPVAFLSSWLWIFPVLALVVAIYALLAVRATAGEYAGELIAQLAVVIALVVGIAAPGQYLTVRTVIMSEAENFGSETIDLVLAFRVKEAYRNNVPAINRAEWGDDLDGMISSRRSDYLKFLGQPMVQVLQGRGKDTQVILPSVGDAQGKSSVDKYLVWLDRWWQAFTQGTGDFYDCALFYIIDLDGQQYDLALMVRGGTSPGDWAGRQYWVTSMEIRPREQPKSLAERAKEAAAAAEEKPLPTEDAKPADAKPTETSKDGAAESK